MEKERKIIIFLLLPVLLSWHWFEPAAQKNRAGIDAYREQKYDEALNHFMSARGIKPDLPELKNNTASTLYSLKKYNEALEEFSKIDPEKAKLAKDHFYYNLANTYFRLNKFDKALEYYKKSLKLRPGDLDAKKNFEITLEKLKNQKDEQKKDQENKKDKKKDKDKKQEQKQDKKEDKDKKQEQEQQQQQQPQQKKDKKKYQDLMRYLNQNEKKQMKNKKRKIGIARKEKDW